MASKVADLVYWRSVGKTGVVFTGLVVGLASMFQLSAITVLSHLFLGILCVTFPLRLYYKLLELLRWNPGVRPFQSHLDEDSTLTDKETVVLVESIVLLIAFAVRETKRLLFIDSMVDSVKFGLLLYLLTYVGLLTHGLTLVIAGVIAAFSFPLLYKKQKVRLGRIARAVRASVRRTRNMCINMYNMVAPSSMATPAPAPAPSPKQKPKSK